MYGVSGAQQQGFQVFRGSTFTISCSIQPQYPGGSFLLSYTSINSANNYTQPAVNHSAHFLFPAAEPAHQGSYSCVYHVSAFSQDFSSESRLLSVTVTGLQAEGEHNSTEPGVRLVGGESRCAGDLELEHEGEWRPVEGYSLWTLKTAGVVCRDLDCGSAVSVGHREGSSERPVWFIKSYCVESGSALRECAVSSSSKHILNVTCSDSVRLLGGTGLCSGRLEVNSDPSNPSNPSWSSVCEADFDQQDAQVVCRQLGCGAPSVLQGALYGEGEAPMWTKEFQCGGHESALLDCSSASERNTCSPGTAVSLTCSEPGGVQLVGGESRCAGDLEVEHQGEWRPVEGRYSLWTLKTAGVACRELDCGSAVSVGEREESSVRSVWWIRSLCVESGSPLRECVASSSSLHFLTLTCSGALLA
ncbi:CD5 antigen-like [Trematomus bernacchii]|uniref:CD5 antigen-like n=1 Tax=Trematomus bernacchii TaxID=40690 RepID=UPI00146CDECF|nr:CD5 antigen-like [Trematomus bernacchii]